MVLLFFFLSSFVFLFVSIPAPSSAQHQLNISSFSLSDSPWRPTQNQTLLSPNFIFAAGFRPVPTDRNLYLFSIWYRNLSTAVWSANARSPVSRSASLRITAAGELRLDDSSGRNLWPRGAVGNPNSSRLILGNDGSLVYANWASFHNPTDTILPTQTINGTELVSNNRNFALDNSSQLVFNFSDSYWSANHAMQKLDSDGKIVLENGDMLLSADFGAPRLRRLTLDDDGNLRIYSLDPSSGQWTVAWRAIQDSCRIYGSCSPNYICISDGFNSSSCVCPPGFRKIGAGERESCQRKIPFPTRRTNSKFLRLDYVNYSGGSNYTNEKVWNYAECESKCLDNPNCLGFVFKYDGSGYCVPRLQQLLYGYWSPGTEAAMFLRVDRSELDVSNFTGMTDLLETTCPVRISLPLPPEEGKTRTRNIAIICTLFVAELICGGLFLRAFLKKYVKYRNMARTLGLELLPAGGPKRFTYSELKAATNNFSNPVGRGGFGDVYKGELTDHRVVAVKCLKDVSGGDNEFWAEVTIIARMHHLNLVRLWGFCAEVGRRILVYEYVPNGSLDKFLFPRGRVGFSDREGTNTGQKPMLDWSIRYRIALGVARAIAYLHEECMDWVLHCDIKPENILLGDDFCPKVSDFGLAKLRKKEDMVSMSRIRGTRGYVAPEWLKSDHITSKADVYSVGMVLLEIVSGCRNYEMQGSLMDSEDWYFPRWAFDKVFIEMKVEEILDHQIKHAYDDRLHFDMVNRMVKTAIWCLQDRPEMRPSMGKVAKMLEGTVEITEPQKPTIFFLQEEGPQVPIPNSSLVPSPVSTIN
ncbi:G-type lectin S-receptor-like serine/threonine-protein kinase At1g34300 [Malania oleifera]|uniref:G-type lectin S-receptor-like serine/threonine-protein kinase At1g34300 n=1 Tax=Malania oleifera TaxID=397392 RepID=UPI0025AE27AC|nr:G-type lectin S-receptor-like serine/threonine-protein kinase At1g34300 [Malania oleifera]